jgi:hypothetical protein
MATQPDLLDDYTKATFPFETTFGDDHQKVRLYAAFGERVVGASYYTYEHDGEVTESLGQVLDWNGQGKFGSPGTSYPSMDLAPPPAKMAERVAELQQIVAEVQARLDSNPDAPTEWRSVDEKRITDLERVIARLTGGVATLEASPVQVAA